MKRQFSKLSETLVNSRLIQVIYLELPYESGKPLWNDYDDFDSVDHGIELKFKDGRKFSITWDKEYFSNGISIVEGELSQSLKSFKSWDVTKSSRWKNFTKNKIDSIQMVWNKVVTNDEDEILYPQTLIFNFSNKENIYLSVCEYSKEQKKLFPMADNVVVIFSKKLASKFDLI